MSATAMDVVNLNARAFERMDAPAPRAAPAERMNATTEALDFDEPAAAPPRRGPLGLVAAIALIGAVLLFALARGGLVGGQVERLDVAGDLGRVSAVEVRQALDPWLGEGFLALDLDTMRAALEQLPWVAQVRIARRWPGVLQVEVREHLASARWGDTALLSEHGLRFAPGELDASLAGLPRLDGPDGTETRVLAAFNALAAALQGSAFAPVRLSLDARGDWTAWAADGLELRLGRGEPLAQAALLKTAAAGALGEARARAAYLDLRYGNGFAVGWRDADSRGSGEAAPAVTGGQ